MQNKRDDIDKIKALLSITEVAGALGIDVSRGKFRCLHPMRHANGDRTPSVSISEEKGLFTCWVCQDMRGDVIELVKQARSCSFTEALGWLQTEFMSEASMIKSPVLKRRPSTYFSYLAKKARHSRYITRRADEGGFVFFETLVFGRWHACRKLACQAAHF